jgi:hypothetical protein
MDCGVHHQNPKIHLVLRTHLAHQGRLVLSDPSVHPAAAHLLVQPDRIARQGVLYKRAH